MSGQIYCGVFLGFCLLSADFLLEICSNASRTMSVAVCSSSEEMECTFESRESVRLSPRARGDGVSTVMAVKVASETVAGELARCNQCENGEWRVVEHDMRISSFGGRGWNERCDGTLNDPFVHPFLTVCACLGWQSRLGVMT